MNLGPIEKPLPSPRVIKPPQEFSAQSIDAWIGHLPLSDVDAACTAIHSLLRSVNMTDDLECLERQRIVEQIRPPAVSLLAMSSEQHLPGSTLFPLPAVHRQYTQRNLEVCLELANAYRRVVTSGTFFSDKVMNDTGRAQIVYRALQAYGLALLRSLERYESPPEGFWLEVYAFYRFAVGHRLHNLNLPMPEIEGATVDSQFKQMLLLGLSSHQHHPPDEIRQFYTVLMLIAKDAEIRDTPEIGDEAALFCFDTHSDNAPKSVKRVKGVPLGERHYVFIGLMLSKAQQYFSNPAHRATDRFKLRPAVIMSLLDKLSTLEKRRFVRKPATGTRRFVVGFSRLFEELSGAHHSPNGDGSVGKSGPSASEEEPEELEIVLDQNGGAGQDEIWLKGNTSVGRLAVPDNAASPAANIGLAGALLNISAGGYCMSWLNRSVAGARVGELIGTYEEGERIHIGIIRWLHHKAEGDLAFGVELSSPVVEAVNIESSQERRGAQRGLYLSANPKLGTPASLLSLPGVFKVGQAIVIRSKRDHLHFILERIVESTLSFHLFSLAPSEASETFEASGNLKI